MHWPNMRPQTLKPRQKPRITTLLAWMKLRTYTVMFLLLETNKIKSWIKIHLRVHRETRHDWSHDRNKQNRRLEIAIYCIKCRPVYRFWSNYCTCLIKYQESLWCLYNCCRRPACTFNWGLDLNLLEFEV